MPFFWHKKHRGNVKMFEFLMGDQERARGGTEEGGGANPDCTLPR